MSSQTSTRPSSGTRSLETSIREKQLVPRWQWLRAHNGNAGNERADALAAQGAREAKAELVALRGSPAALA